jgi:hypothetical protein
MNCKICNTPSVLLTKGTIFPEKMEISYYRCPNCGFIQTEEPHWLDKAYSDVIAKTDIGLVSRNIQYANLIEKLILNLDLNLCTGLDYGGGYGMFTRLMRDKGFDFYWCDDYCENLFANGFEGDLKKKYDIITAFEVLEHLPDPQSTLKGLIENSRCAFFSTCIHDYKDASFLDWWYRAEYSGQHISFFTTKAMEYLAKQYKRKYYYIESQSIHIFSDIEMDQKKLLDVVDHKPGFMEYQMTRFVKKVEPRRSLLTEDHELLLKKYLDKK